MISVALAKHLRDMRISCNRQFHDARLRFPHLDATQFGYFLESYADGLVNRIEQVKPQAARQVAMAAYQHGLQLTGMNWLNGHSQPIPTARGLPILATAWERYLPDFICTHTDYAREVMVMVAHALHQFSLHDCSQPLIWLQRMHDILPHCASFTAWKQAGLVLAWQAGLAHHRTSALAIADGLPEALALRIAGAATTQRWSSVAKQFQRNPWWTPEQHNQPKTAAVLERWRVGAFAEFGGAFTEPPQLVLHPHDTPENNDPWFIKSGNDHWQLHADTYGATLHRLGAEESKGLVFNAPESTTTRFSGNHIFYNDALLHTLDDVQSISSWACNHHTIVVCSADTFAVIVLSLVSSQGADQ